MSSQIFLLARDEKNATSRRRLLRQLHLRVDQNRVADILSGSAPILHRGLFHESSILITMTVNDIAPSKKDRGIDHDPRAVPHFNGMIGPQFVSSFDSATASSILRVCLSYRRSCWLRTG